MEAIYTVIKVTLPNYLKKLPVPKSFDEFAKLTGDDWMKLLPFLLIVTLLIYAIIKALLPSRSKPPVVNLDVNKQKEKVVDVIDVEDLDKDKVCYCRCWRSSKFPICDGTHNKHNERTGDNVGPLVVRRGQKK